MNDIIIWLKIYWHEEEPIEETWNEFKIWLLSIFLVTFKISFFSYDKCIGQVFVLI